MPKIATWMLAALLAVPAVHAGRSCETKKPTAASLERGMQLAADVHRALEAEHAQNGTRAVVLARAGQDLSPYGLRYSHLGLVLRNDAGEWRVVHKLNQCGTARADVYRQGLGEFFLDDLWRYTAAWAVPAPHVQQRLVALLEPGTRAAALHQPAYSVVSYAWGRKYQQSNQWAIETLALAMDPAVGTREKAQAWLLLKDYQPSVLRLGPLTRMGARVSAANVAFDDHPDRQRFAGRIETVTADSVFAWLQRSGLAAAPRTLTP